ncbi:hypothetical protein VCRA2126O85_250004 [Vibrio crassostreae]|nr:hypothetical protein VCRA2128O106_230004 [Vibrio crassostreae]CAK2773182.1 hypothetical protein VCRA2125O83_230004 [Vibrio crassostreae]CAK2773613.1 hypothetical protein VCRA2128O100_250004 [Vibrio crassostreae]CAK2778762.1 hypothetical protein VCRA2127O91_250004 [Vibrio crassostreae]CAK2783826.1 hypothetical protein VCRA2126O85_250004 [Vibrio crassostreae]
MEWGRTLSRELESGLTRKPISSQGIVFVKYVNFALGRLIQILEKWR